MKIPYILPLILLPFMLQAAEPPLPSMTPEARVVAAVEEQARKPFAEKALTLSAFSRVVLSPPALEWGKTVDAGYQAFTLNHIRQGTLPGLVHLTDLTVFLLDTDTLTYVPAAEHPVLTNSKP
ncbi:MAG: hypothetical protein PF795_08910 [Kiritimatiellae bacterium]|jgi:hypothetical protein|nr:hypothetical protein [Kiritimatiellia bacterium]